MAHVTNELIYEVLKSVQSDISELKFGQQGIRQELSVMRGHLRPMQSDIHNIYLKSDRHHRIYLRLQ